MTTTSAYSSIYVNTRDCLQPGSGHVGDRAPVVFIDHDTYVDILPENDVADIAEKVAQCSFAPAEFHAMLDTVNGLEIPREGVTALKVEEIQVDEIVNTFNYVELTSKNTGFTVQFDFTHNTSDTRFMIECLVNVFDMPINRARVMAPSEPQYGKSTNMVDVINTALKSFFDSPATLRYEITSISGDDPTHNKEHFCSFLCILLAHLNFSVQTDMVDYNVSSGGDHLLNYVSGMTFMPTFRWKPEEYTGSVLDFLAEYSISCPPMRFDSKKWPFLTFGKFMMQRRQDRFPDGNQAEVMTRRPLQISPLPLSAVGGQFYPISTFTNRDVIWEPYMYAQSNRSLCLVLSTDATSSLQNYTARAGQHEKSTDWSNTVAILLLSDSGIVDVCAFPHNLSPGGRLSTLQLKLVNEYNDVVLTPNQFKIIFSLHCSTNVHNPHI